MKDRFLFICLCVITGFFCFSCCMLSIQKIYTLDSANCTVTPNTSEKDFRRRFLHKKTKHSDQYKKSKYERRIFQYNFLTNRKQKQCPDYAKQRCPRRGFYKFVPFKPACNRFYIPHNSCKISCKKFSASQHIQNRCLQHKNKHCQRKSDRAIIRRIRRHGQGFYYTENLSTFYKARLARTWNQYPAYNFRRVVYMD